MKVKVISTLEKCISIIKDLDNTNSDMQNELNNSCNYRDYTQHSEFGQDIKKLIEQLSKL